MIGLVGGGVAAAVLLMIGSSLVGGDEAPAAQPAAADTSLVDDAAATTEPPVVASQAPIPTVSVTEVLVESTVLSPTSLVVENAVAELEYELSTRVPVSALDGSDRARPEPIAYPEAFVLITTNGERVVGEVRSPVHSASAADRGTGRVRFNLGATEDRSSVAEVRLEAWRVAVPLGEQLPLPVESGASVTFRDGTVVTVDNVLVQSTSTIVQVAVEDPDNPWDAVSTGPVNPGWRVSGRQFGGLQFVWDGQGAPQIITMTQQSPTWLRVGGELTVWVEAAA